VVIVASPPPAAAAPLPAPAAASAAAAPLPAPAAAPASSSLDALACDARITVIFMTMAEMVYGVSPDALQRMGRPPINGLLECNGVHKAWTCAKCNWNRCIICGGLDGLDCIVCCNAKCSCSHRLHAWGGRCVKCKGLKLSWDPFYHALNDALEAEYSSAAPSGQPPAAPPAAAAQPTDDDAEVLAIYLPEWVRPAPGGDPMERTLFESADPKLLDEMQAIVTESAQMSRLKSSSLTGYSSQVMDKVQRGDEHYIVEKVEINQNPVLRLLYQSQLKCMRYINATRDPSCRVDHIEKRLFHGTAQANKIPIARDGLSVGKSQNGACGRGANYASEFVSLSVEGHADSGKRCMVILVDALVGRNARTESHHREPPAGYDSGGDGTGWKYAIFENSRIYPRYFITLLRATQAEFDAEMRRRAKRARRV